MSNLESTLGHLVHENITIVDYTRDEEIGFISNSTITEDTAGVEQHHGVDHISIDFTEYTSPCGYRVPKSLSETKPEVYTPHRLGIGPYHHLRSDLYTMHIKKLADVIRFVGADVNGPQRIEDVKKHLEQSEYLIRTSYDERLDLDRSTLARVVVIDAIYLLRYCDTYHPQDRTSAVEKKLAADVLMLENQIPGKFLLQIQRILKGENGEMEICKKEKEICKNILSFLEQESPLKFIHKDEVDILALMEKGHLLSCMYNLILANRPQRLKESRKRTDEEAAREVKIAAAIGAPGAKEMAEPEKKAFGFTLQNVSFSPDSDLGNVDLSPMADLLEAILGVHGGSIIRKELSIVQKMPWSDWFNNLKEADPDRKQSSSSIEKINIPSVSHLVGYAGIRFAVTEEGIKSAEFNKEEKTIYLPALTLNSNSEIILKNLLAYEAATTEEGATLAFAEYVDLMCAIVDSCEDVMILRKAKITVGDLDPAEIVRILNGIPRSTGDADEKKKKTTTNIGKLIKEVKEMYDSAPRVKAYRYTFDCIRNSWKGIAIASSVIGVAILLVQAFCVIYGCSEHWWPLDSTYKYNPLLQIL